MAVTFEKILKALGCNFVTDHRRSREDPSYSLKNPYAWMYLSIDVAVFFELSTISLEKLEDIIGIAKTSGKKIIWVPDPGEKQRFSDLFSRMLEAADYIFAKEDLELKSGLVGRIKSHTYAPNGKEIIPTIEYQNLVGNIFEVMANLLDDYLKTKSFLQNQSELVLGFQPSARVINYLHNYFLDGIVGSHLNKKTWYRDCFLNLTGRIRPASFANPYHQADELMLQIDYCAPLVFSDCMVGKAFVSKKDLMDLMAGGDIVDYLASLVREGLYLHTKLDHECFLEKVTSSWIHDVLIYGFNERGFVCAIADHERRYHDKFLITFDQVRAAFLKPLTLTLYRPEAPLIVLYKHLYSEKIPYKVEREKICQELAGYSKTYPTDVNQFHYFSDLYFGQDAVYGRDVYDKVLEFIDQGTRARFSSSLPAIHTLCEHKKILKESVSELGLNDDLIQKSLGDLISQSERLKLIWMNFVRTGAEREKTTICQMIKNLAKADEALFDQFRQRGVFN
jgi:hypothetical protein